MNNKTRILILEDFPEDARLMKRALENENIKFVSKTINNKKDFQNEAIEFKPDLILSDFNLPDYTGMEAIKYVIENTPDIPIIIVTGSIDEETAVECIKKGASDYVLKDNLVRLVPAVKNALNMKNEREEKERAEKALFESEKHFRGLANSIGDVFFEIDEDLKFTYWNKASEIITGIKYKDAIGQMVYELFGDIKGIDPAIDIFKKVLETKRPDNFIDEFEIKREKYFFELSIYPSGKGISVLAKDITEKIESLNTITHLNRVLKAVRNVNQLITKEKNREILIKEACKNLYETAGYSGVWMMVMDENKNIIAKSESGIGKEFKEIVKLISDKKTTNCVQEVMKTKKIITIDDIEKKCKNCPLYKTTACKLNVIVPLKFEDQLYGFFCVGVPEKFIDMKEEKSLLQEVADDIAFALYKMVLEENHKIILSELERERKLLRTLIDEFPDPIYIKDSDSRFLISNYANARCLGKSNPGEVVGKTDFDFLPAKQAKMFYKEEQEIIKSGYPLFDKVVPNEEKTKWSINRKIPFNDSSGKITGLIGINQDITKIMLAEEAIRESEEKHRTLFETMAQGVLCQDSRGKIINANPAAEKILGLTLDQMQGRTSMDPRWKSIHENGSEFPGDTHPAMIALKKGVPVYDEIMGVFNPIDETYHWIKINAVPKFRKDEKRPYQVYTTFEDVTEIKNAEISLRESEEKYRGLFENSIDFVYIIDLKGNYVDVNKAAEKISGYKREELIGMNFRDYIHKDDLFYMRGIFKNMFKTGKHIRNTAFKARIKNGSIRYFETSAVPIRKKNKIIGCQGISIDVTERRKTEKTNEALYKISSAVHTLNSLDGLYKIIHEVLGEIIDVTNFFIAIYDEKKDVISFPYFIDEKDDDMPIIEAKHSGSITAEIIRDEKPLFLKKEDFNQRFEEGKISPFGTVSKVFLGVPLRVNNKIIGAIAVQSYEDENMYFEKDIKFLETVAEQTAMAIYRIKADKELAESEEKYRTLTENLDIGIYRSTPGEKGSYLGINSGMVKMFGYKNKEEFFKITPGDLYQNFKERKKFSDNLIKKGIVRNQELHLKKKDGTPLICLTTGVAVNDKSGKTKYFDGFVDDITEQKMMEQMLMQSEKMASIGTIAAGVAHEINNPMGYISSNLKILETYSDKLNKYYNRYKGLIREYITSGIVDKEGLNKKIADFENETNMLYLLTDMKDAVSESIEGANKVKKIVMDLKDFSRVDKPRMEMANINEVIEKSLNIIWNELKYKAEILKEFGDIPEIECDNQKLNQVFINILINAAQAIENRGKITIKTLSSDNSIIIRISDTGCGIPKEKIKNIFDAFYTTKDPGKGTGLGLSISYKIIEEHKGTINVESEVGRGTTFIIRLPVKKDLQLEEHKILIVDDDKDFCFTVKDMILDRYQKFLIKTANDGFEAAEILNSFQPEFVLLDIHMPGMDGMEVCKKIKNSELKNNTEVIMVSGDSNEDLRERALEAGAYDFLKKPVVKKDLFNLLDHLFKG